MTDVDIEYDGETVHVSYSTDEPNENVRVLAPDTEEIELDTLPNIRRVNNEDVSKFRYHVRDISEDEAPEHLLEYLETYEALPPLIVTRRLADGYEVIDGNHRFLRRAELLQAENIPVHVLDIDDWEAMHYWVKGHFPLDDENPIFGSFYGEEEQREALEKLLEKWSKSRLREIPELDQAFERLDM